MTKAKYPYYTDAKNNYFVGNNPNCKICKNEINDFVCVHAFIDFGRKFNINHYCEACAYSTQNRTFGLREQRIYHIIVPKAPKGSFMRPLTDTGTKKSNDFDCFSLAIKNQGSERVNNNCRLALKSQIRQNDEFIGLPNDKLMQIENKLNNDIIEELGFCEDIESIGLADMQEKAIKTRG